MPAVGSKIRYPHPYFGRKILVFLRLQAGLRCKIVKTKEFPAKSSRIRSYGTFWPLLARLKGGAKRTYRDDDWRKTSEDHCATKWGNNLQGTGRPGQTALARHEFVVSQVPTKREGCAPT